MARNLVIVESPAKAKTIEKFLGKDYKVMSSFGHIRDLADKGIGIDFDNNYAPQYAVSADKKKLVAELKKESKTAETVWLASDEDREGEAIAWHLYDELKLKPENTKRIVFHEITKNAILHAVENPRNIDNHLVDAQQARRVLDRIVGFELSPILWRKIKPALSAGRVQSVVVRMVVEREREIQKYTAETTYRVVAYFTTQDVNGQSVQLKAELQHRFATKQEAQAFLEHCRTAQYNVSNINCRPTKKSPAAPFTTSTLQQEASRKLGYTVAQTMRVAQSLYEAGKITYMRTDSVNLSDLALATSKEEIINMAGEQYVHIRKFKTKDKSAQEAHEAIRPTYMNQHTVAGTAQEKRLYELIWKRTIASQMSDAQLEKTTITIAVQGSPYAFACTGEVITFDGFLKVYLEGNDDENEQENEGLLPQLALNTPLAYSEVSAQQRYSQAPPRYTEASMVGHMKELGIGRPSTYAPTISTIQNREYVAKGEGEGFMREYNLLTLANGEISDTTQQERTGSTKGKLIPTDIGIVVNDFLVDHFPDILSYHFTADVEAKFDTIAEGNLLWTNAIDKFYTEFHPIVEDTLKNSVRNVGERILGNDPATGKPISVKIGRYGLVAQLGATSEEEKPTFASLQKGQTLETITLEQALDLFKLPRVAGQYEEKDMTVAVGRFGPYVRHASAFYSIPKTDDPLTITAERAIEIIEAKREADRNKVISTFGADGEIQVLNGRFGPYIAFNKANYKIPKTEDAAALTHERCLEIIASQPNAASKKRATGARKKATPAKKTSTTRAKKK